MTSDYRGTGQTTKQMADAPQGAIYVWCDHSISSATGIARSAGRHDLKILRRSALDDVDRFRGLKRGEVIFDHALKNMATDSQKRNINIIKTILR